VGRIGSGVRLSASFQKYARLVGRLGSGPRLVADRADVVFSHARVPYSHFLDYQKMAITGTTNSLWTFYASASLAWHAEALCFLSVSLSVRPSGRSSVTKLVNTITLF